MAEAAEARFAGVNSQNEILHSHLQTLTQQVEAAQAKRESEDKAKVDEQLEGDGDTTATAAAAGEKGEDDFWRVTFCFVRIQLFLFCDDGVCLWPCGDGGALGVVCAPLVTFFCWGRDGFPLFWRRFPFLFFVGTASIFSSRESA